MKVNFPANCNNEASRWSYATKLLQVVINGINAEGKGMTTTWRAKKDAVHIARIRQIEIAKVGSHWNPKVPDHVSGGNIHYPQGLNQNNEGSRASFLFGVEHKLKQENIGEQDPDLVVVKDAIRQAKKDAINGTEWDPSIEDIQ